MDPWTYHKFAIDSKTVIISKNYDEKIVANYMKNEHIELDIEISTGIKNFTAYTMDLTNKYIEINSDYCKVLDPEIIKLGASEETIEEPETD